MHHCNWSMLERRDFLYRLKLCYRTRMCPLEVGDPPFFSKYTIKSSSTASFANVPRHRIINELLFADRISNILSSSTVIEMVKHV